MAKTRQFNIRLDEETLGEIESHPLCKYESVSTAVRHLLRIGLKADKADRDDGLKVARYYEAKKEAARRISEIGQVIDGDEEKEAANG